MSNRPGDESSLEAAAGAAGPRAIEAFEQLASETRLAILLALWEAYEPFEEDTSVPFSDLRDRVGMRDKGQFYYHLDKLVGHFVRQTDDGYVLRNAGRKLVRAIIAGTGLTEASLTTTQIDKTCPHCGAPTAITYENEWLFQVCTECDGTFAGSDDFLPGTLTVWPFDQAGLADRSPEEMFAAGAILTIRQYASMIGGVCPECSGAVDPSLDICEAHDPPPGEMCPTCDRRYAIQARLVCTVCKNKMWGPPSIIVAIHPGVIAFYADHGVGLGYESTDLAGVVRFTELIREHDHAELVSTDPVRIRVAFRHDDDELRLTLDETLTVRSVDTDE